MKHTVHGQGLLNQRRYKLPVDWLSMSKSTNTPSIGSGSLYGFSG